MSTRCGCAGSTCGCVVTGGGTVSVAGRGTARDPYVITGGTVYVAVGDSATIDFGISGTGSSTDPYVITGDVIGGGGGGGGGTIATKTTSYTLVSGDGTILFNNAATATATLPAPGSVTTGKTFTIKAINTAQVDIVSTGGALIDGVATRHLTAQYQSITVISDGSAWWII